MALTNEQLLSLGFKPSVRGRGGLAKYKKYDSLVLPLNETDFLYTGYNPFKKQINYKSIWKSFKDSEGNRVTYCVVNIADTGYFELKNYIKNTIATQEANKEFLASNYQELLHSSASKEWTNEMAVEEGSFKSTELKDYPLDLASNSSSDNRTVFESNIKDTTDIPEIDG